MAAAVAAAASSGAQKSWVMLSYCWSEQATVKRIRNALGARGTAVWIDVSPIYPVPFRLPRHVFATAVCRSWVARMCHHLNDSPPGCADLPPTQIEQMLGSTVDSMADAVDNSICVCFAMSREYKESSNCKVAVRHWPTLPMLRTAHLLSD